MTHETRSPLCVVIGKANAEQQERHGHRGAKACHGERVARKVAFAHQQIWSYDVTSAETQMKRRAVQRALSSGAYLTCGHRFVADAHIATIAKRHEARKLLSLLLNCVKRQRSGRAGAEKAPRWLVAQN